MNPNSFAVRRPYIFSTLIVTLVVAVYLIAGTAVFMLKLPNQDLGLYMIANISLSAIFLVLLTVMRWWKPAGFQALTNRQHLWMYALSVLPVLSNLIFGVQASGLTNILTYLVLAASIGFVEEVAFRGLILRALAPRGMWRAAIISAVLFGLVHSMNALAGSVPLDVILQIGYTFAIGFCWAAIALRTRVLWPLVVIHALIDFASFLANDGFNKAGTATFDLVEAAVYTLAFAAYGIYLLRNNRQPVKSLEASPARS
jgi:membrane protease YdiL (CAAX protease family)